MKIFCTTISLIIGLYFFRNNIVFSIIISLIYLVFIFIRFNKKFAFLILTIFIGGAFLGNLNLEYNDKNDTYQGMVIEVKSNYFLFLSHYEKFYVYEENTDKEIGDFLTIKSKPSEYKTTTYESRFDFGSYLKDKGVRRSLTLKEYNKDFVSPLKLQKRKKEFLNQFDDDAKVLINAVLFNEKDYSSDSLKAFNDLNIIYIVSVSGIHLHLIFASLTYVFGLYTSKKIAKIIPILLYSPLIIFSFPRISILRIFFINLLAYFNEYFLKKRFSYLTLLSILALFFVIIDYHLVYQESYYVGFSLSLLGVFYRKQIQVFAPKVRKYLLSVFAYLMFLPLLASNRYELHFFSFLEQLVLSPFFILLINASLLSFIKIPLVGFLNSYCSFLVGISKSLLLVDLSLPIMVNEWFVLLYYVSIFLILYFVESQRLRSARNMTFALASLLIISLYPRSIIYNSIYFINVGQGDCILIHNHNKNVLIDTGGVKSFDIAKESLIPFFNKIGVHHINLLVTTHDDFDHAGAKDSLIENFKVYEYKNSRDDFPYKVGDIYLENINFYNGDENDSSLVFLLDFMNKKWLLTGDASIESEKAILSSGINIDCDILKVGHHGSKTSSSEEFIKRASPMEAIISCGATNRYGHPNKEVLDILNKYNVKIRRTDIEGTISYVSMWA